MKQNRMKTLGGIVVLVCMLLAMPLTGLAAPPQPFTDVPENAWFAEDVRFVSESGLMNGTAEGHFAPAQTVTRAQMATILHRMAGEPISIYNQHLIDVAFYAWYAEAVFWSFQTELMDMVGYRRFGPEEQMTREGAALVLFRFAAYQEIDTAVSDSGNLDQFDDRDQISDWAETAMDWAVYHDLLRGVSPATLAPDQTLDRAQTAALIHRFIRTFEIVL